MDDVVIEPMAPARWDDLQDVLAGGGDGRSCQCVWPVLPNSEWRGSTFEQREAVLRSEVESAAETPGLLAYAGGAVAGWVRVGPRSVMRRTLASRLVRGSREPLDDDGVWAITCFSIRREHRGHGLMGALLEGAVRHARERGARVLEAYPFDLGVRGRSANDLYVGALSTFEEAGFSVVPRPTDARAVVALEL